MRKKVNHIWLLVLICVFFIRIPVLHAQKPRLILQTGNTDRINQIEFDREGKLLLTTFGGELLHLWDLSTSRVRNTYTHDGRVTDACFFSHSPVIASSTTHGNIFLWKYEGKEDNTILSGHSGSVNAIDLSLDGQILVSAGADSTIKIWDLVSNKVLKTISNGYNPFECISLGTGSSLIFAGDMAGNLLIVNIESGEEEYFYNLTGTGIRDIDYNPVTNELAIADNKGLIHIVSLDPVTIKLSVKAFAHQAYSITFQQHQLIATGRDITNNIRLYQYENDTLMPALQELIPENNRDPDFIYGVYDHTLASNNLLAVPAYDGSFTVYDLVDEKVVKLVKGLAAPVRDISINENTLLFGTAQHAGFFDLSGLQEMTLSLQSHPLQKIDFIDSEKYAIINRRNNLMIFNRGSGDTLLLKTLPSQALLTNVTILPGVEKIIYRNDIKKVYVETPRSGKTKKIKVPGCNQIISSGSRTVFGFLSERSDILVTDGDKFKKIFSLSDPPIRSISISSDGKRLAYHKDQDGNKSIKVVSIPNGGNIAEIKLEDSVTIDRMRFLPGNDHLVTYARSVGKYNQKEDYSLKIWRVGENPRFEKSLKGHSGFITSIEFSKDRRYMFSSGIDGTIRCWSLDEMIEKVAIIPFTDNEWVTISPDGRFDSSPRAMSKIHFVFKNEMLHLDQLKENFYEPRLLQKILGYTEEDFITDISNNQYELYPEIYLTPPQINDGILEIRLEDQGGGIGKTSILINDKEVLEDIRSASSYDSLTNKLGYPVREHPYLKKGELNKLTIESFNDTGYRISKKKNVYLIDDRKKSDMIIPHLYAITIGVSDYRGDQIDLNFAAKDASDFSNAVSMGARKFLGDDHVHLYSLTTDQEDSALLPTKENIEKAILHISTLASPNDILIVYLSGHGLDTGTDDAFYFLTAEAEKATVQDQAEIRKSAISSNELIRLIKLIPALKQLLIVDACHSGNLVSSSMNSDGRLNSKSIKALEYLKDRTGTFILASSEGTEVSYESNALNQGLLTYSLLFGMKGAGLMEGDMIDVSNLLQFVNKNVPELAGEIGRTQKPVIKVPVESSSFQIGKLSHEEREMIDIAPPKPIVIRSHFQNEQKFIDDLHFSTSLNTKIRKMRDDSGQSFIFIDESDFSNAYAVYGRYTLINEQLKVDYRIFKNDKVIFNETLLENKADAAIEKIAAEMIRMISELEDNKIIVDN